MDVLGKHRVSWETVRRLAIECHALDSDTYPLLTDSILNDKGGRNRVAYEELFTEKLLTLAIALRTKFYQGTDPSGTINYASDCGLLYRLEGEEKNGPISFTFKDVCNKIIHADKIEKCVDSSNDAKITTLYGCGRQHGKMGPWKLGLSVTLFAESVLNWLSANEDA